MMKLLTRLLALIVSFGMVSQQAGAYIADLRVGPVVSADGSVIQSRATKDGAQTTTDLHGRFHEPTVRGAVMYLDSDSITIAAAHTTKGALGTVKLINGFFNPSTSGKNASILYANVATVSGTPAGPYFWNFICGVNVTSAVTGTIRSGLLSANNGASNMMAQVNVVVTVTGGNNTALTQLALLGGPAATAVAGGGNYNVAEEIAGRIVVPPGCLAGLTAAGAGTSHVVQSSIAWEELNP